MPSKCFLPIGGKIVLQHILNRIKPLNCTTYLAVPTQALRDKHYDDLFIDLAMDNDVNLRHGHDDSPLHRMVEIVESMLDQPKYVIRITHDDILIDAQTIVQLVEKVRQEQAGYGISPSIVEGAGIEVIAVENLLHAAQNHAENVEYISYFVKGENCPNPRIIKIQPRETIQRPYRLTLDYYEDYVVLESIFRELGINCTIDKICEFLDMNLSILSYNRLPEVSLYTCVKNGGKWIKDTIDSAFCDVQDREYLLIDDASTDDTLKKVLWMSASRDIKIHINQDTQGLASSSNKAISMARGKYIMRIDADDMIRFNTLNTMKQVLEETGAVICYANYDEINEKGHFVRRNVDAREHHHAGCALMNKRWLNEIRFKEGIQHWDSLELYKRIKDRFPIAYVDQSLWFYRIHDKNLSKSKGREKCKP